MHAAPRSLASPTLHQLAHTETPTFRGWLKNSKESKGWEIYHFILTHTKCKNLLAQSLLIQCCRVVYERQVALFSKRQLN